MPNRDDFQEITDSNKQINDILDQQIQKQQQLNNILKQKIQFLEQQEDKTKKLSYQLSQITSQLVDHTKLLLQSKSQYQKLSNVGKKFADSLNFSGVIRGMQYAMNTQNKLSGKLYGTYKGMNSLILTMSKNASNLGQQGFESLGSSVEAVASQLSHVTGQMQQMMTKSLMKQKLEQSSSIQQEIADLQLQILSIRESGVNLDSTKNLRMEIKLRQKAQQEIQDQVKNSKLVAEDQYKNHVKQVNTLSKQLDVMKDQAIVQQALNQKVKKHMQRIDMAGQILDKGVGSIGDALGVLNVELPGIQQALKKIKFSAMAQSLKKLTSQTLTSFSQGWGKVKSSGKKSFKQIAKFGANQFKGLATSITGIMRNAFFGLIGIFVTAMVAMFTAGWARSQQQQQAALQAQQGAGALTGKGQPDFYGLYQQLGGMQHGGAQKIQSLYSNMERLRDITSKTAAQVQVLDRQFGVSSDTSTKTLINLRYMTGASEKTSGEVSKMVARFAVLNGMQPQKVMQQMASASGEALTHFGDSPQHLARTVMFAKRLGLTIDEMARSAEGFMDIQKTIATTMQLQALTGKQIDVASLLQLTQAGRGDQATALLLDSLGDSFDKVGPYMQQKIAQSAGLSVDALKRVRHQMKLSGLGAMESITNLSKQVKDAGQNQAKAFDGVAATQAAAYLTPMQQMGSSIKNILADAFSQPIKIVQNFLPKLIPLFKVVAHWMGDKLTIGLRWIIDPKNQKSIIEFWKNKVVPALQTIWKTVKWLWDIAVKFVKWAGAAGAWIAELFGGDQTIGKIVGMGIAIFALLNPVKAVSIAFSGLSKVFNLIFGTSRRKQAKLIADAVQESMGENRAAGAAKNISSIFSGIGKKISSTWQTIKLKGMYAMDSIKSGWETVKIKGLYAMDGIKKAVTTAGSAISGTFKNVVSSLSGAFSGIKTKLGPFISNFGSNVGNAFKSAKASLMNFVSAQNLAILKTKLFTAAQNAQAGVSKLLSSGSKLASTGFKSLGSGAKAAMAGTVSMGKGMLGLAGTMIAPPMGVAVAAGAVVVGLVLLFRHLHNKRPAQVQRQANLQLTSSLQNQTKILDGQISYWEKRMEMLSSTISIQDDVSSQISSIQQQENRALKISDLSGKQQYQLIKAYNQANNVSINLKNIQNEAASSYLLTHDQMIAKRKLLNQSQIKAAQLADQRLKKQQQIKMAQQINKIQQTVKGTGGFLGTGLSLTANQASASYLEQQTSQVARMMQESQKLAFGNQEDKARGAAIAMQAQQKYANAIIEATKKGLKTDIVKDLQAKLGQLGGIIAETYGDKYTQGSQSEKALTMNIKDTKKQGKLAGQKMSFATMMNKASAGWDGFFAETDAWILKAGNDTTKWLGKAGSDSAKWLGKAKSDSAKWLNKASNDSAKWISSASSNTVKWSNEAWNKISKTGSAIWDGVSKVASNIWDGVSKVASGIWDGVSKVATGIWSGVSKAATSIWDGVSKAASGIWSGVSKAATGIWSSISGFFSSAIPKFFTETLPNTFKNVLDGVTKFINKYFYMAMRSMNSIMGVNNVLIDDQWLISLWQKAGGSEGTGISNKRSDVLGLAQGGIIQKPTVAVIGQGRQPQVVAPISDMYKFIDEASRQKQPYGLINNSQTNKKLDVLISLFTQIVQSPTTVNMVLDGNKVGSTLISNAMKSSNMR